MSEVTVIESADNHLVIEDIAADTVVITETDETTNTVTVESEPNAVVITHASSPDQLMVTYGGSVYRTAVEGGFTGTEVEWISAIFDSKASIRYVTEVFSSAEEAWSKDIMEMEARVGENYATLDQISEVYANEEEARASLATDLMAEVGNNFASNTQLSQAIANTEMVLAQNFQALETEFENNYASIQQLDTAITTESEARTSQLNTARSEIESGVAAQIDSFSTTIANEQQARVQMGQQLTANLNDGLSGAVTRLDEVDLKVDGVSSALSQTQAELETVDGRVGSAISTLESIYDSETDQMIATGSLAVNVDGSIAGIYAQASDIAPSSLKLNGDVVEINTADGNTNLFKVDTQAGVIDIKARIVLQDGHTVSNLDDIRAEDGEQGPTGAGWYSATLASGGSSPGQSTISNGFRSAAGREPVRGDVLFATLSNGGQRPYEFTTSWLPATLTVNGSIIATGTIHGDRIQANTQISSPIIMGGQISVATPSAPYFEHFQADPFGPTNDLVNWFGPRINGQTWNTGSNTPRPQGMTKLNAKSYKTVNGDVFFGGTFQAGTLSLSRQTTNNSGQLIVDTGAFTIPGNTTTLSIAASLSVTGAGNGLNQCPTNLPNVPSIVNIERLQGSNWMPIGGDNRSSQVVCFQEGPEHRIEYDGGLTATTQLSVSAGQSLTLRATGQAMAFPNIVGNTTLQGGRSLSIVVSGG